MAQNVEKGAFRDHRGDHGHKLARPPLRARAAVSFNFFGERLAARGFKPLAEEEIRRVRHGKDTRDAAAARLRERKRNQLRSDATPANLRIDAERTNLRQIRAIIFERHAAHHVSLLVKNEEMSDAASNLLFRARQKKPLLRVMRDEPVNRLCIGKFRLARPHGFSSSFARRDLKSSRAERTAPGAVPPAMDRRASADSSVRTVPRSRPKAGENSFNRSSGISRMDLPSASAARNTFPTI